LASDIGYHITFAERVEMAWLEYDGGIFESRSKEDFLKELDQA